MLKLYICILYIYILFSPAKILVAVGEVVDSGLGSRVFLAPWSRSRLKKNRSRSRLEKKSGAGAAKKLAGSSAL